MNNHVLKTFGFVASVLLLVSCSKAGSQPPPPPATDTGLVNLTHLNYLYTPVTFPNGANAAGVYIYADAPDYHLVGDADEGFTCVDDVARATLVYLRSSKFLSDTAIQSKAYHLISFIVEMQSDNGYFYNFLFPSGLINKAGSTSSNTANWWSWRALHALTEAAPLLQSKNAALYAKSIAAIDKLIARIKTDLVPLAQDTKITNGITVPTWLPAGSGTDQAALMIVGLINYRSMKNDDVIKTYIKKLADGISMMQAGDATQYPYGSFLSWENTWHAYGNLQAFALLKASAFLNDSQYKTQALNEIDNFYSWLLANGMQSSFSISHNGSTYQKLTENKYDQIAYGIEPMVSAAAEAFKQTGQDKYADMSGHLAAWLLGANDAGTNMYDRTTGRGYDGLGAGSSVNRNSGAESTIEALLTLQITDAVPAIKAALYKYKK
jgi:hypothetical protein